MPSPDQVPPAPSVFAATAGDIVILKIGPDACDYRVHRALLIHHSKYFRTALRGDWKEAREGVVPLLDIELQIFKVFVEWLYTGALPGSREAWLEKLDLAQGKEDWMKSYTALGLVLLKAYVFGDRFGAPTFRSAIMDNIISHVLVSDKNDELPGASIELVNYAYTNIASKSAVLQLLVDGFCQHWSFEKGSIKNAHKKLPSAFLHRILARYGERLWEREAPIDCRKRVDKAQEKLRRACPMGSPQHTELQAQFQVLIEEQTMLKLKLRERCYREHLTDQDKEECAKKCTHMCYDKDADYGFFE